MFFTFWLGNVLLATAACHFSNSWTSKSGPELRCFAHFDLQTRFAPKRRAISRHLNCQKCSRSVSFLAFWLAKARRATAACNFSTSELPRVLRTWCVLYILTSKCASRHSGAQFFMSPLKTWLRTRRFSEPTFRPSRHTNHWKNTAIRDFPNISRNCIFFLQTFAQLHILSSDSTFLLCFSTLHIVGSFISKLPLTMLYAWCFLF